MFAHITKIYYSVTTEDIRLYLSNYQDTNKVANTAATEPFARQNRAALPLKQSHVHGRRATLHGAVLHSITTPPGVFHRLSGAKRRRSLW